MPAPKNVSANYNGDDIAFLLLGHIWSGCTLANPRGQRIHPDRVATAWAGLGDRLCQAWIQVYPCTRPFAYWLVGDHCRGFLGEPSPLPPGYRPNQFQARNVFGIRRMDRRFEYSGDQFETQAEYLQRTFELKPAELSYLADHPELLEADPKIEWSEELGEQLAKLGIT